MLYIFGLGILLSLFEQGNSRAIHRTSIFMMIYFNTSDQVCQKQEKQLQLEVQDHHRSTNLNKRKLLYHWLYYIHTSSHFED